jgi:hypothetical protein
MLASHMSSSDRPDAEPVEDPERLVALAESSDPIELAGWRSLLEGAGIAYVVQGAHHASLLAGPLGNPAIVPRILVAEADRDHAASLLGATPVAEDPTGTSEGVCPVHEQPALGTCDRCGTFVCARCAVSTKPPVCESCGSLEERALEDRRERGRQFKRRVIIGMLVLVGLSLAATMLDF